MDERAAGDSFLIEVLGTFHTLMFIMVLIISLYLTGRLGYVLGNLNTLIGFALFAALWASTYWATGQALRRYFHQQEILTVLFEGPVHITRVLILGMLWGGIDGALFSIAPLFAVVIFLAPGAILAVLIVLPVAFGFGAIAGLVIAAIDGFIIFLIHRFLRGL